MAMGKGGTTATQLMRKIEDSHLREGPKRGDTLKHLQMRIFENINNLAQNPHEDLRRSSFKNCIRGSGRLKAWEKRRLKK
jgi:hypothetical protein